MIQSQQILLYSSVMVLSKIGDSSKWFVGEITIIADRGTTRIHIRLQWDTRVGYNVYELYCPLESNGQFGPSADPAIVATTYYCSHRLQQIPSRHLRNMLFDTLQTYMIRKSIVICHIVYTYDHQTNKHTYILVMWQ